LQRQVLFREGVRIKLPARVHEVLLILIEQPGDVVTREVLRARLWPTDVHVNYDANVNTTVKKLRQVLGDSPEQPVFVETIPRKGYAFIAKVEYTDQAPAQAPWPKIARAEAIQEVPAQVAGVSFFQTIRRSPWFTAGVVALLVAGMLLGAAAVFLTHRS
jgi:DNA-binding winged helix-turn-helix (wHTH) protein